MGQLLVVSCATVLLVIYYRQCIIKLDLQYSADLTCVHTIVLSLYHNYNYTGIIFKFVLSGDLNS